MGASQVEDKRNLKLKVQNSKLMCPSDLNMKRLLIGFTIIMVAIAGCGKKEPAKAKPAVEDQQAKGQGSVQHKVLSFSLEGLTDKGEKKWGVTGKSAEAVSETEVKLDDIVAKTYGDEGEATITADKGVYDKSKNNVRLEKNVKATIEGTQGFSGELTGFTDEANAPSKEAGADSGKPKKKTKTIITCDGDVLFDYEKNLAYFNKNVKVSSDDGNNIDADKITVNMDPATKKVKEIMAEGNVRISNGENITYSDNATYVENDKKVVLSGKPKLVITQEGNIGDKI